MKVVEQIVGLYVRIEPHTDPFLPRDRDFTIRPVVSVEFSTEIEAHSSKHGPMRLLHVAKSVVSGLVVAFRRDARDLPTSGPLRRGLASFRLPKKPPLVLRSQKRITSSRDRFLRNQNSLKKCQPARLDRELTDSTLRKINGASWTHSNTIHEIEVVRTQCK